LEAAHSFTKQHQHLEIHYNKNPEQKKGKPITFAKLIVKKLKTMCQERRKWVAKGLLSAEPEELQAALANRVRHTPKKVGYQKATKVRNPYLSTSDEE
jgi:hypothetical protein